MILAAAVFCLAYYLIICKAMGKWNSTFAGFWPGAGAACLLGHAAVIAGPRWLRLAVESSFSIALFVFVLVEIRILRGMRPDRETDCPFIIVLGAQIRGTEVTVSLRRRLDTAISYLKEHPGTMAVLSGGQGREEAVSEARAMGEYMRARGISQARLILEERSTSTRENFAFSSPLIPDRTAPVGIVTNSFHMYRAKEYARRTGYQNPRAIPAVFELHDKRIFRGLENVDLQIKEKNMKNMYDCYTLNNGVKNPCLGYGTYKAADGKSADIIQMAIEAGYRYFDTASFYGTEEYLAEAIRRSGVPREEFFITSKAWKTQMGYENVKEAFRQSLEALKTDYLDLYLIHWPLPEEGYSNWKQLDKETWRGLEELYEEGKVKAIGVSNFLPHHIENLLEDCRVRPAVDQIEFHPGYTQEMTVRYCQEKDILVQAWSPIGRRALLDNEMLQEMAGQYGVSVAQLCIRYAIQRGIVPLPKSSAMERMKQNQDVFGFEITEEDMYRLGTMPQTGWSGLHPDAGSVRRPEK